MLPLRNVRLVGEFALLAPLSHIGETISTTAYLVQEPILQPGGGVEEVFCYSGNAWRGQLRDLAALYMCEQLSIAALNLDAFHLFFSGGRIGGDHALDISQARAYRRLIPLMALFGGGIGNQIVPGKLRVANCYPVCKEAMPALRGYGETYRDVTTSYRGMTFEKSFSRKDDGKDDRLSHLLTSGEVVKPAQAQLFGGMYSEEPPAQAEAPKAKRGGAADQMRMTVELLAAGTVLATRIDVLDCSDAELGCLVSALHAFSRSPHIGGQAGKGHGMTALSYDLVDLDSGERVPFLAVRDACLLAPAAAAAKDAYDQHLRAVYEQTMRDNAGEIKALLGVAS